MDKLTEEELQHQAEPAPPAPPKVGARAKGAAKVGAPRQRRGLLVLQQHHHHLHPHLRLRLKARGQLRRRDLQASRQRRAKAAQLASFALEASDLGASYVPRPRSGRLALKDIRARVAGPAPLARPVDFIILYATFSNDVSV